MEHAVKTTDFCIPDIGRLCAFGDQSYDCCPPFSCTDDGSGRNVKRCLYKDDEGDQGTFTHNPKHQPQLSTTDDGDDDICLPPWQQGHMICGIGQPRFKCCASKFFECKPFGQSGIYGCQQKGSGDIDDAAVSPMGALDDDICLPPWDIAHMFCGVGQPKYRCCGPDMECKQLAPESIYYGCKFKNEDGNGGVLRKLLKEVSESISMHD